MSWNHPDENKQTAGDGLYRGLFHMSPVVTMLIRPDDGEIIDANNAAAHFYGYSVEQLRRMQLGEIIVEPAMAMQELKSVLSECRTQLQQSHRLSTGETREVETDITVVPIAGERLVFISTRDVSATRQLEREQKRKIDKSLAIIENTSVGVVLTVDRKITFANATLASMLGYTLDQLIGQSARILYSDDAAFEAQGRVLASRLAEGKSVLLEQELVRRDGRRIWVRSSGKSIDPEDPEADTIWVSADMTAEVRAVTALRQSERHLSNAQSLARVGSWWMGRNPNTWTVSEEMASIFGIVQAGEASFEAWVARIHPDDWGRVETTWNASLRGAPYNIEYRIIVDGKLKWVHAQAEIELDEHGRLVGAIGAVQDITEHKLSQEALLRAREAAQAANHAKSQFLATMSHEIRTPLNVVIGTVHAMDSSSLNEEAREDIEIIESSSRSLLALINDILDLSKIEAGEFHLDLHPFSLRALFHDLGVMFRHVSAEKGLRFTIDIPARAADLTLVGDANRLRQILINLIGNAFKFTSRGEVRVDVAVALEEADERADVTIAVRDTGVGIAPEEVDRLFKPFQQIDSSTNRSFGGTGLGLSIVSQLVSLMGGDVKLEGEPGRGTTASLHLPFRRGSQHEAEMASLAGKHAGQSIAGANILVVDDSDLNLRVIDKQLATLGARPRLCRSGKEAIDAIRASPDGYDLVLMDIQMPEMDGFEATKAIRKLLSSRVPVVALTAGATVSEMQRSRESGMDEFLTKPVSSQVLQGTIARLVKRNRRDGGQPPEQGSPKSSAITLDLPVIAGIDVKNTVESFGGNLDAFRKIIGSLVSTNEGLVEKIRELIASENVERAMGELHKLRGEAGLLGCGRLHDAAAALEEALSVSATDHSRETVEFEAAAEEVFFAARQWLAQPLPGR